MTTLLTLNEVVALLPVSRATFFRSVKNDPTFPAPLKIGARNVWREDQVREFCALLPVAPAKPVSRLTKLADKHVFQNDTGPGEWVMVVDADLHRWLATQGVNLEPWHPVEFSEDEMAYAYEGRGYAYIMLPEEVSVLYQMTFS